MTHPRGSEASKTPKDEQRTPKPFFDLINSRFHFDLDAAATLKNSLCPVCFTKEMDALKLNWNFQHHTRVWCNPPYSNGIVGKFVEKGYLESLKGATVVMLITSDVSPEYYDTCALAAEWITIKGRIEFWHEDGTPIKGSSMFGSNLIVFDQKQKVEQGGKTIVTRMDWRS